jgi:hypothetical protein
MKMKIPTRTFSEAVVKKVKASKDIAIITREITPRVLFAASRMISGALLKNLSKFYTLDEFFLAAATWHNLGVLSPAAA